MNISWYLNRLKKMSPAEVVKRLVELVGIYWSRVKYREPSRWPYYRFAPEGISLKLYDLPGCLLKSDWTCYQVYNYKFDLTEVPDWYFSDRNNSRWPNCHYSKINYRSGNLNGDVRINWELNRLQFLPAMAVSDENLANRTIIDWLKNNPYLHGPAYLASMEVALRWISIYWAACLFKNPLDPSLVQNLTGLAIASGRYIQGRLSTHSSAGNHLIVEAVGLFWIGRALEDTSLGTKWISSAREILREQICRQIHPDGSNREQTLWYLGFVLDAVFHYYLLEDRQKIPKEMWNRVAKALDFVDEMTLPDGSFPDYGDRDDGTVFRIHSQYGEPPFNGLLNVGAFFYERPDRRRDSKEAKNRYAFWTGRQNIDAVGLDNNTNKNLKPEHPRLKTYPDGGMTSMTWGKGRLLFRHSLLGLDNSCGHGHADALSIIFFWNGMPVLIDPGSGQYNADQNIRNYFRSTIAHNTIEVGGANQAEILGPFMWDKSYQTRLEKVGSLGDLWAQAIHDGYLEVFSTIHTRAIFWSALYKIEIRDSFSGSNELPIRGAFHFGACRSIEQEKHMVTADFGDFTFSIQFSPLFTVEKYFGSRDPFIGWRSAVYGEWEPINSIIYSSDIKCPGSYTIVLSIGEAEQ